MFCTKLDISKTAANRNNFKTVSIYPAATTYHTIHLQNLVNQQKKLPFIPLRNFYNTPIPFGLMKFGVQTAVNLATQTNALSVKTVQETMMKNALQEIGFDEQEQSAIIKIVIGLAPVLSNTLSKTWSTIKFDNTLLEPRAWLEKTIAQLKTEVEKDNFSIDVNLSVEQRKLALTGAAYFVEANGKNNNTIYKESINKIVVLMVEKNIGINLKKFSK